MDARRILKGHVADKPRLLLVIQEERAAGNAADQMAALVGLEVAQRSHVAYYTIFPTPAPPPLLHHCGDPGTSRIGKARNQALKLRGPSFLCFDTEDTETPPRPKSRLLAIDGCVPTPDFKPTA